MDKVHYNHRENTGQQEDHFQEIKSEFFNIHLHNLRPVNTNFNSQTQTESSKLLMY